MHEKGSQDFFVAAASVLIIDVLTKFFRKWCFFFLSFFWSTCNFGLEMVYKFKGNSAMKSEK